MQRCGIHESLPTNLSFPSDSKDFPTDKPLTSILSFTVSRKGYEFSYDDDLEEGGKRKFGHQA